MLSRKKTVIVFFCLCIYEDFKTVSTRADGVKYELVQFEPRKYNMLAVARYVKFEKREVEIIE